MINLDCVEGIKGFFVIFEKFFDALGDFGGVKMPSSWIALTSRPA
ncbi:MAG: hypothetical protein R2688_02470 [Fimbriimonadaceae bacterium]